VLFYGYFFLALSGVIITRRESETELKNSTAYRRNFLRKTIEKSDRNDPVD